MVKLLRELGLTYILVSHDLGLAAELATEIAVMEAGQVVEQGPAARVIEAPRHRLTCELVAAAKALAV
jgi:peptide/nickel transport system ATP-binding protein